MSLAENYNWLTLKLFRKQKDGTFLRHAVEYFESMQYATNYQ